MQQLDLKNIPTADLYKELERRKQEQIPVLVDEINANIDILKSFGVNIIYERDCDYALQGIKLDEDTMEVLYTDRDITL